MDPESLRKVVRDALARMEDEFVVRARPVVVTTEKRHSVVSWPRIPATTASVFTGPSLAAYRTLLRDAEYSAVLFDGALLQVTYAICDEGICKHRLCYYPCPFSLDIREWPEVPLEDLIDTYPASSLDKEVRLVTPVRFDLDVHGAGEGHPASHFTMNSDDCRLCVTRPLSIGQFLEFVVRHFYSHLPERDGLLASIAAFKTTLDEHEIDDLDALHHLHCP